MTPRPMLRSPSAYLPVLMSAAALAIVLAFLAVHGAQPQPDEGAAAHLWQLLMGLQLPLIVYFAFTAVPRSPRPALRIMALQVAAAMMAMAPVLILRW